jgi:hypothetical protein
MSQPPVQEIVSMETRVIATLPVTEQVIHAFNESVPETAATLPDLTEIEQARLQAALANARGALRDSEKGHGILFSPQNKLGSLVQSLIVENRTDVEPIGTTGLLEAKFDTRDWGGWLGTFWQTLKGSKKFPWRENPEGPARVPQFDKADPRIALFSDWGTGLYGAPFISASIAADPEPVDVVMHLGDVYYSGKEKELASRFTALWPDRPGALNRSLNANHEMYCGGKPYMDVIASPRFSQPASYFAIANDRWVLVGLDSAYDEHDLAGGQAEWLQTLVSGLDPDQRVVLFSHHQPFSILGNQGPKLVEKLKPLLEARRIFAWYWGHEHHCILYDKHEPWGMFGRCVGHAGMPEFRPDQLGAPVPTPQFRTLAGKKGVPGGLVLDGPNADIPGEEKKFMPHGYVTLQFAPDRIIETVYDSHRVELRRGELL